MNIHEVNSRLMSKYNVTVVDASFEELGLLIGGYDHNENVIYINIDILEDHWRSAVIFHELLHKVMGHAPIQIGDIDESFIPIYEALDLHVDQVWNLLIKTNFIEGVCTIPTSHYIGVPQNNRYIFQWAKNVKNLVESI